MFEKVNPAHPDKVADRIAGAIVDLAYKEKENPKIAVEVLIGHGSCSVIIESDIDLKTERIKDVIYRITGLKETEMWVYVCCNKQDSHLNKNQQNGFKCGDNGIFKGMPITREEQDLANLAGLVYSSYPYDGKYVLDETSSRFNDLIICQSHADMHDLLDLCFEGCLSRKTATRFNINPIGNWTGGLNVDTGATNRKLGSDMGGAVTGGGLHGKDLSKADVSVNIYAFLKAQETGKPVELFCAIGDDTVDGKPYSEIVEIARDYIEKIGGFEKFAEWGLIRPEVEGVV